MIALDTNILVYAHRSSTPQHGRAADALRRASQSGADWGWPQPVVAEFWKVLTHPASLGGPTPAAQAAMFLQQLLEAGARCWRPTPGCCERLLELAVRREAAASQIFDLEIALIARDHGATEIWSHDADFPTLAGVKLVDPLR